jgi:deoxyribodipyrimidine photolyase-related protein
VKKVRRLALVLGDQLNFDSAAFDDFDADRDAVLMIEAKHEATYVPQHKQRLMLFFSAMRHFRDELREGRQQADGLKTTLTTDTGPWA